MAKEKIVWLDSLRAIACLSVIAVHIQPSSVSGSWVDFAIFLFGRIGVPSFVMISGGLNLTFQGSNLTFLKRRLTRTVFPFFIWSVIYVIIQTAFSFELLPFLERIVMIPFVVSYHHLWFIFLIIGLYLVTPILAPWIQKASNKELGVYCAIWLIVCSVQFLAKFFPQLQIQRGNLLFSLQYFSGYIGYYVFGYYLVHRFRIKAKYKIVISFGLVCLSGLIILLGSILGGLNHFILFDFLSLPSIFLAVSVFLLMKDLEIKSAKIRLIVKELADKSFGIYLVHLLIIDYILSFCQSFFQSSISSYFIMSINLVLTVTISYIVVKIISFIPQKQFIIG